MEKARCAADLANRGEKRSKGTLPVRPRAAAARLATERARCSLLLGPELKTRTAHLASQQFGRVSTSVCSVGHTGLEKFGLHPFWLHYNVLSESVE